MLTTQSITMLFDFDPCQGKDTKNLQEFRRSVLSRNTKMVKRPTMNVEVQTPNGYGCCCHQRFDTGALAKWTNVDSK